MSFLKKIVKVAAPFASLIPGVGPLIGMGLGAIGSIGGGGSNGSKGATANDPNSALNGQVLQQLLGNIKQQGTMSQGMFDKGMPLIDQGAGAVSQSNKYFGDILGGKADQALAGPISDMKKGYAGAQQSMAQFAPRGGGMVSSMMDRSNQLNSGIARLKTDSMNNAASGLLSGGNSLLGGGTSLTNSGMQGMAGASSGLLGISNQQNQMAMLQKQLDQQSKMGLGQGIGSLLGMLLSPGGLLNGDSENGGFNILSSIKGIFGGGSGGSIDRGLGGLLGGGTLGG